MGIGCQRLLVLPLDTRAWTYVEPALEMAQAVSLCREMLASKESGRGVMGYHA